MNFLAHARVADPSPDVLAGNLIADFVKGPAVALLPPDVQVGIRQHRRVDSFTDSHPCVQRAITRISARWGWFSGIILDVYFDHLLARDWHRYTDEPLRPFADRCYDVLRMSKRWLPPEEHWLPDKFTADDRLVSYATEAGIADALRRVSMRVAARIPHRALPLEQAMPDLRAADAELEGDFRAFFPQLIAFAAEPPPPARRLDK